MKAELVLRRRQVIHETQQLWVSMVVWRVPTPVRSSLHFYKYRLALIHNDVCVLRYDNEAGKGDHKHLGEVEAEYLFQSIHQVVADFLRDVQGYSRRLSDENSDH